MSDHDLMIIGAGTLGARVGKLWLTRFPESQVLAETRSSGSHANLRAAGMKSRIRYDVLPKSSANILFSVPPSAQQDYKFEVLRAARLWNKTGVLLMVSSTAVYAEGNGGTCDEKGFLADTPRAKKLLAAEQIILEKGGSVVRLTGLYNKDRGPHRVFLRLKNSSRRPDGILNLIHYDDAADLCIRALAIKDKDKNAGAVYLGCDNQPITRQELTEAAVRSGLWAPKAQNCIFTGTEGPMGRRCLNSETRKILDWQPHYHSFYTWLDSLVS